MTTPDIDRIAYLDWRDVRCQNVECGCGSRECVCTAAYVVECHAVDDCHNHEPFGNVVQLVCVSCLRDLLETAAAYIAFYNKAVPGGVLRCLTCGAPLAEVSDLLRSIRPLT